ncbi:MAG: type II secretion system protein [Deltaproteobacteria bacterium]|nr:type II secretion system protein [Deltaproteobacteria bacterium]
MLRKMHGPMSNEKAFTLIEVIVSLVLIGIMAAIAGMGLMRIAEGYVFTKQNAEATQKAQIAMARMVKELAAADTISAAAANAITYTRPLATGNIITISPPNITLTVNNVSYPLMDKVVTDASASSSKFLFYDKDGTPFSPTVSTTATIRRIDISLKTNGANNTPISFSNSVYVTKVASY